MIQYQLKLRPCKSQAAEMDRWLFHLESVWNWAVRKIELNARNSIYFSLFNFRNMLSGHSATLGIPSHVLQGVLTNAHGSWVRCFKKLSRKPKLRGQRNHLNSIPFPDPIGHPKGNRVSLPGLGSVRFHSMDIPKGKIKSGRIVRRASGWYLCLFIDSEPKHIDRVGLGSIGIDPGFSNLVTTSDGLLIEHPRELRAIAKRLAQAQRGHRKHLASRLFERASNRRKDRNHKLSRDLVSKNIFIAWSADDHSAIAKKFGKSVSDSGHYQLRTMLAYKSRLGGTQFVEVSNKHSTMTCSACGCLSGPTGLSGLAVRQWECACGATHDRDINAAMNTLIAGLGMSLGCQEPKKIGSSRGYKVKTEVAAARKEEE